MLVTVILTYVDIFVQLGSKSVRQKQSVVQVLKIRGMLVP
jgi:hypothetical protein